MTDEALLDIAAAWSPWGSAFARGVPRRAALPELRPSLATVVQGVRRCGKSTFLRQLVAREGLDPGACLFANFEDPRLVDALNPALLDALVGAFARARPAGPRYVFLDEIQAVPGWERWLRAQLDRPGDVHFFVTGSNATLLAGELGALLTGRHQRIELFPFDLAERRCLHPEATLEDHLRDGGFPEPLQMRDGDGLRRQYARDIIERDVRERLGARSALPLMQVLKLAYEAAGSELSARRVAGAVGVATDTAVDYLAALESAYLLFGAPYFAFSERKRAARNKKYYPVDTGLRRLVVNPGSQDRGKALECATYLALRRAFGEVAYWRGEGGEVDFVVRSGDRIRPVQVSWDGGLERDERALVSFYESFPFAEEALLVTAESFAELDGFDVGA